MGWWSTNIMGGDTPLDMLGDICDVSGVEFDNDTGTYLYSRGALEKHEDMIVTRLCKKGDHYRTIGFQVLGHMALKVGARLKDTTYSLIIEGCEDDEWAAQGDANRIFDIHQFMELVKAHAAGQKVDL